MTVCFLCFRSGKPFASSYNWWRINIPTRTSQTWSLSLLAHGIWVRHSELHLIFSVNNLNSNENWFTKTFYATTSKKCSLFSGSVPPPKSVASWVLCRGLGKTLDEMTVTIPHDLYVFGSQENSVCDREWVECLRAMLKEQTELDYKPVRRTNMMHNSQTHFCFLIL